MHVYILGAGCSCGHKTSETEVLGMPLAAGFVPFLEKFAKSIEGDPTRAKIHGAVLKTVELFSRCESSGLYVNTIDKLADQIYRGNCDEHLNSGNNAQLLRYSTVREIKIATAAAFLDHEKTVKAHQIHKYCRYILKLFQPVSGPGSVQEKLKKLKVGVISFNYDNLFEWAFHASMMDKVARNYGSHSAQVLNSGLAPFGNFDEIAKDQFAFLKMHGSTGWRCDWRPGRWEVHQVIRFDPKSEEILHDGHFFGGPDQYPSEPLIMFPYEKQIVLQGNYNKLPSERYLSDVWGHAAYLIENASVIHVIGYSFDPHDALSLIELLKRAKNKPRLIVQNLGDEPDRIIDELKNTEGLNCTFEAKRLAF